MLGQTLGSYTIERELGRGGMGAVYTAVHGLLGRRAAVKVLRDDLSRDQASVQRFFNEARALTAIKHPSIVEIYDFGFAPDGAAFIVMELMEGESLAARLRRVGRLPVASALVVARQVATALAAAHRAGIVHRDLKPDNAFLVADPEVAGGERVKLLDFGVAKLAIGPASAARTSTGAIVGTPHYMSPEQCEGSRAVDHRSDLYSLGVMLFEMLTGRLPFVGEGVGGIIGAHLFVEPPAVRSLAPEVPPEVEAFVAQLLAKTPDARPQTADEVVTALGRLGAPTSAIASHPAPRAPADPAVGHLPTLPTPARPEALDSTLSAAARMPIDPGPAPRRSRRGLLVGALGGGAVAAVAVIAIVAAGGGSDGAGTAIDAAATAPADAALAIAPVDAAIDAPGNAADAVAAMRFALAERDFPRVRALLDAVYDATTDGDAERAEADRLFAEARPLALDAARTQVATAVKERQCTEARELVVAAAADWSSDATAAQVKALERLAASCKLRPGGSGSGSGSAGSGSAGSGGGSDGSGSGSGSAGSGDGSGSGSAGSGSGDGSGRGSADPPAVPTFADRLKGIVQATRRDDHAAALPVCRELLAGPVPRSQRPVLDRYCAIVACNTGEARMARDLIRRLPRDTVKPIVLACTEHGIDISLRGLDATLPAPAPPPPSEPPPAN